MLVAAAGDRGPPARRWAERFNSHASPNSPSSRAGLRARDVVTQIGSVPILAQGDVLWALHNAPLKGGLAVQYLRDEQKRSVTLELPSGWRITDFSWRRSMKKEKKFLK